MPVPVSRPRSVIYAWEVEEHPIIEDGQETFTKELTCSVCGKTWQKAYPIYAESYITEYAKRCPDCRPSYRNAEPTRIRVTIVESKPDPQQGKAAKTLTCEHCGRTFIKLYRQQSLDSNSVVFPKYCKDHTSPSSRKPRPTKPVCPTPSKKKFQTRHSAQKKALSASRTYAHPVRVYRCPCGSWHMTVSRASNYA